MQGCTSATSHVEAGLTEQYIGKITLFAPLIEDGEEASYVVLFADGSGTAGAVLFRLSVAEARQAIWQVDRLHADFGYLVIEYA